MHRGRSKGRMVVVALVAVLVTTGLVVLGGSGCGSGDSGDTTTSAAPSVETTSTTVSSVTSGSVETTASTTGQSQPSGQIGGTVSVSSTNGAYPKDGAPDWSQIKSVEAYRNASFGVASLFVSLATYDVTAGSISEYWKLPSPPAGQGRIELVLTRTLADTNEPPLVTGAYDFNVPQGKAELTGAAGIVLPGGTTVTFSTGGLESDVQVTRISETEVTGTFRVKDKWSEISGTFTAPIK